MSEHHPFHFSRDDAIHQPEKLCALKIESSSNFEHPLIHLDGLLLAKLLQRCVLVLHVWFLRLTGHPAVGDSDAPASAGVEAGAPLLTLHQSHTSGW